MKDDLLSHLEHKISLPGRRTVGTPKSFIKNLNPTVWCINSDTLTDLYFIFNGLVGENSISIPQIAYSSVQRDSGWGCISKH